MQRLQQSTSASQREPAGMPLQRERLAGDSLAGAVGSSRLGVSALPADSVLDAMELSVRYALSEYVGFCWQHCSYLIRRRRIGALASRWLCAKSTARAALHFVLQGRSRRTYAFTIDTHGIVRTSGTGVTLVPWRDVSAIRRYTSGFMIVMARGTLPIPLRCMDRMQIVAMEGFAALVKAARKH